jgi:hypothetical protein
MRRFYKVSYPLKHYLSFRRCHPLVGTNAVGQRVAFRDVWFAQRSAFEQWRQLRQDLGAVDHINRLCI